MDRRTFLASTGVGLTTTLGGCATSSEFDPDVDPVERIGAAPRVSMHVSAEKDFRETAQRSFEEWATRRATEHATEHLQAILRGESLTGPGVSVGQGRVNLNGLDRPTGTDPPRESEFRRAVEIGPRVFHYRHYSRHRELLTRPGVEFRAIVDATPRAFEVTMDYPAETYVAVLPALCRRGWIRNS